MKSGNSVTNAVKTVQAVPKKIYEAPGKLKHAITDMFVEKDPMDPGLKEYLEKKEKEESSQIWSA